MRERRKDARMPYGFLLDRDVSKAAPLFPKKRTKTIADIGLPQDATDAMIVKAAWERQLTIVTGNGRDFVRAFNQFLRQTTRKDCHEMRGLVVLPNGYEQQKRLLQHIERSLTFEGEKLTWARVADEDFYVRVKRLGVEIRPFERCFFCRKNLAN